MRITLLTRVFQSMVRGFSTAIAEDVIGAAVLLGSILRPFFTEEEQPFWAALKDGSWVIAICLSYFVIRAIVVVWKEISKVPKTKEVESLLYLADGKKEHSLVLGERPANFQAKLIAIGVFFAVVLSGMLFGVNSLVRRVGREDKIKFMFKYSPALTDEQKAVIERDLNDFSDFLVKSGIVLPASTPMISVQSNDEVGCAGPEEEEVPTYYSEVRIPLKTTDDRSMSTSAYSCWVMDRLIVSSAPKPKDSQTLNGIAEDMMKRMRYRTIFAAILSRYFSDSFWGKPIETAALHVPLSKALWEIRGRCHESDRLLGFTVRAFADDKSGNYPKTPDEYFFDKVSLADRTVMSSDATQLPCVEGVLKEYGISTK